MTTTDATRRDLLAALGGMFGTGTVLTGSFSAAVAAEAGGTVSSLVGSARATAKAVDRLLAMGARVNVGDLVETLADSRIGIALGKTVLRLGPASSLKIEKHLIESGEDIELLGGNMYFEHTATTPRKATVRSPYGLIAVRGTKFLAGTSAKGFGVFVAEGQVDVTGAGRTVRLTPGLGTDIARPGQPPSPPRAWPQPRVRQTFLQTLGTARLPR